MEGVVSFTLRPLYPWEKVHRYVLKRKMIRSQNQYACFGEEINNFRCMDSNSDPFRPYTYYAIPNSFLLTVISLSNNNLVINFRQVSSGVGNLRHACQAWHMERFSMAR